MGKNREKSNIAIAILKYVHFRAPIIFWPTVRSHTHAKQIYRIQMGK